MLESAGDINRQVGLDLLRNELQRFVTPPPVKAPTYIFESRQESAGQAVNTTGDYLARLEAELERQETEEKKWTELKDTLETKAQQAADTVVRLTTSLTVFRNELANKSNRLSTLNDHLLNKQESAHAHMEKLRKDQATQREQAERATETADQAEQTLRVKKVQKESVEQRLNTAYQRLKPLDEKVQDLEVNLYGNTSLSGNQREYLKAEVKVERDQRDRLRAQVTQMEQELEGLSKECTSLAAKQALFRDEHKRRTAKFHSLTTKIQEQDEFFQEQLQEFQGEVETVRSDRDAWEAKTLKLAEDLDVKQIESQKLNVKLSLFGDQLKTVQAAVVRLTSLIRMEASKSHSRSNSSATGSSSASSGREEPAPAEETPKVVSTKKQDAYVWKPPQTATVAIQQPTKTKTVSPSPARNVVKVNHPSVTIKPAVSVSTKPTSSVSYQQSTTKNSYSSSTNVSKSKGGATLEDLQRDLQHQKRFQQEHAHKMEQQYARLASKMEGLGVGDLSKNSSSNTEYNSMESQLRALKLQVQKDALRDSHDLRQLMQQMSQQVAQLTSKLESLTQEVKRRDDQNDKLEQKLREKESQHSEQIELLRREMDRQLERQQHIFADKISQAMIQMERVAGRGSRSGGSSMNDSMASLESLPPMIGEEEKSDSNNAKGYSMASAGIKVLGGSPLYQKK